LPGFTRLIYFDLSLIANASGGSGGDFMRLESEKPVQIAEETVRSILVVFGVNPSSEQVLKVMVFLRLILKWNQTINLTSIRQPEEIVARHFGESMFASHVLPVEKGRLADVGSGAGFPGLALKIISPDLNVTLVEPNKKKCAFLWEVIRALDLSGVDVVPERFEETRFPAGSFDYVTARGLGGLSRVLRWASNVLKPGGSVIFWVGGTDALRISHVERWHWDQPMRIPESQRRFLLIGRQVSST
jgi:16S rRNA (guanine527-N7)-methyltransferase